MKNVSLITTRDYVKRIINFDKTWIFLFILLIILNFFIGNLGNLILLVTGLFLAMIGWYSNKRLLKTKGNIVSKTVMDINAVKTSLLHEKIVFVFLLIFIGFLAIISIIVDYKNIIGYVPLLIFILFIVYKRIKFLSNFIKKK